MSRIDPRLYRSAKIGRPAKEPPATPIAAMAERTIVERGVAYLPKDVHQAAAGAVARYALRALAVVYIGHSALGEPTYRQASTEVIQAATERYRRAEKHSS